MDFTSIFAFSVKTCYHNYPLLMPTMKRFFYLFLMMSLFVIAAGMVYLSILVVLVRNGIIPLQNLIAITNILMSVQVYFLV